MAGSIVTEFVKCDLCGSEDQELLYTRLDPVTGREFHLMECACGMAFVNPMPTEESIPALYPADYLKDKQDMTTMYRRMMDFLPSSKGRLLDIGCGRGDFIRHAAGHGWEVEGADLLEWDHPEDVTIHVGDFTRMDLPQRHYDAITAWAILEHVRRPSAFFEKISRSLKETGSFVFLVPNFRAIGMRRSCTEDVPRHLHLFTPESVEAYLKKFGMEIHFIYHSSVIYTAHPFGLLRYYASRPSHRERLCSRYQNRSIALLRNRQIKGNAKVWLKDVFAKLGPADIALDALDLGLGILLSTISRMLRNYGVITVVARFSSTGKTLP